jgi:acylphosphatase
VRAVVRGRVQGVGFRASAAHEARRLGVGGWVRNLPDGSVELEARGTPAAVDALVTWLGQGPRGARVTAVEAHEVSTAEIAETEDEIQDRLGGNDRDGFEIR